MAARNSGQTRLLPPLELEAMKALWQLGEGTVREVSREMSRRRPLAYTTVMTLLDRLARKGAAGRRKQGRAHVYHPLVSREAALELAVERITQDFFGGSRERLALHLRGGATEAAAPGEAGIVTEESLDETLL